MQRDLDYQEIQPPERTEISSQINPRKKSRKHLPTLHSAQVDYLAGEQSIGKSLPYPDAPPKPTPTC